MVADVQTAGRGRSGKKWESPKGGLWFSILLRPHISPAKAPLLQFLAANSARRAIEEETGLHVQLKWPNDLVTSNGKLGGILVESKSIGDRVDFAIVGIGINVNQTTGTQPPDAVSLLSETKTRHEKLKVLRAIVNQTRLDYARFGNPSMVMSEWWRNCIHRPLQVEVTNRNGTFTGITRSIDKEGGILLEADDHSTLRVSEGTLRILKHHPS